MTKKTLTLMFIPIFILLYASSRSGSIAGGLAGILLFIAVALAQFILKR